MASLDIEIDHDLLKKRLTRLNRSAFAAYTVALFNHDSSANGFSPCMPLSITNGCDFYQPYLDSYGDSIHRVFLFHSLPIELFDPNCDFRIDDPDLMLRLAKVRNAYAGKIGRWGMVDPCLRDDSALKVVGIIPNICGLDRSFYENLLIPAYQRLKRFCGLKRPPILVGSPDSFFEKLPMEAASIFESAVQCPDGISISLSPDEVEVREFATERCLGGIIADHPYEPVFVTDAAMRRGILHDFESLLRSNPLEENLQKFLVANYRAIFGDKYDRVETQLWLRFPELDVANKNRRMDIFLRNSVINDWELFELKRTIQLSRTSGDVPVFVSEVTSAIQQTKNYSRLLAQDTVKRHFAKQGIEYFEPRLNIVVGRTPDIPHEQWRWLRASESRSVNVLSYDDLLEELRTRSSERYAMVRHFAEELR